MDFLLELLMFLLKTLIIAALILAPVVIALAMKDKDAEKSKSGGKVELLDLKTKLTKRKEGLKEYLDKHDVEQKLKEEDPKYKKKKKKQSDEDKYKQKVKEHQEQIDKLKALEEEGHFCPHNLFVLNFKGSTAASEVKHLRLEIDALLDIATDKDEVVIKLDSPGGMVNGYGLCASQLVRIREKGIRLVACVDSVAASGGYLMACVAHEIVAAPFAYIGSIGVIAAIPNFNKVLKKHNVEYEQMTAGKYKRTLTMFGENTEEGRKKFKEDLAAIHDRFKEQVLTYRKDLNVEEVATGEHWLALDAKEKGLVDAIMTSDEYINKRIGETYNLALKVQYKEKKDNSLSAKLKNLVSLKAFKKAKNELLDKVETNEFMHIK